jgi:hypothetical protein
VVIANWRSLTGEELTPQAQGEAKLRRTSRVVGEHA